MKLQYSKSTAGMLSTAYDIGGVAGSALIGIFIDRLVLINNYFHTFNQGATILLNTKLNLHLVSYC